MTAWDEKMLFAFMRLAEKNKAVKTVSLLLYQTATMLFFCLYAAAGLYLLMTGDQKIYLYTQVPLYCLWTGYALRFALKRKRPYERYDYPAMVDITHKKGDSFPSNHALSAMVIACGCCFINGAFGAGAVFLAVLTGLSRVFVGVHYFSDVIAGWLLGMGFGFVGFVLY